jgi:ATPase subunit of ABC transporter with duplicated ATPase domains
MLGVLVAFMAIGAGCGSKKKAMEAQKAAEKARMEQEAAAKRQREEEDARKRREAEDAQAKRDAEARARAAAAKESGPQVKLEQYFNTIANASNPTAANNAINDALGLFASPETPVLIVIHEADGEKDYDRPTNIKDYLNYLKDQKKRPDRIGNLQFDGSGKIKEVELVKQK